MMTPNETFEKELINDFAEAVNRLHGVHINIEHVVDQPKHGVAGVAEFWAISNRRFKFLIEVKKKALFPRDLPQIIWTIQNKAANNIPEEMLIVLLAETISTGAKEWLQNERVGYYDTSGSLFLPTDGAYILIDRPQTRKQTKTVGSVFEGRRAQVIEALWRFRRNPVGVKDIAKAIKASASTVSEALTELERRGWVESQGNGPAKLRQLKDWKRMLDEWTSHEQAKGELSLDKYYVPIRSPRELAEAIEIASKKYRVEYEITGEWAANQFARHLSNISQIKVRMTDKTPRGHILAELGAKRVTEGWNLALLNNALSQEMCFREQFEGVELATPLRCYLDLLRSGGRAKELAQELRLQRLQD